MAQDLSITCAETGLPNCAEGTGTAAGRDLTGTALPDILATAFLFIGFLATLYLIIAGIQYVLSGGDPNKTAQAKDSIIYALVGMALSVSMFAILRLLFSGEIVGLGL